MGKRQTQNKQVCLHFTLQRWWVWARACQTHTEADSETHSEGHKSTRAKHKSAKSPVSMWLVKIFVYFQAVCGGRFISPRHLPIVSLRIKSTRNGPACATEYGKHWFSISGEELEQTQLTHVIVLGDNNIMQRVCVPVIYRVYVCSHFLPPG